MTPKKGDRQPEKMQRRLMIGTAEANGRADQQGEDPDSGERDIQGDWGGWYWRDRNVHLLPCLHARDGVMKRLSRVRPMQRRDHLVHPIDRLPVNREQDVAALQPRPFGRGAERNFRRHDLAAGVLPQNAVFEFPPVPALGHVQAGEEQQERDDQTGSRSDHAYTLYPQGPSKPHTPIPASDSAEKPIVFSYLYYMGRRMAGPISKNLEECSGCLDEPRT